MPLTLHVSGGKRDRAYIPNAIKRLSFTAFPESREP